MLITLGTCHSGSCCNIVEAGTVSFFVFLGTGPSSKPMGELVVVFRNHSKWDSYDFDVLEVANV